MRVVPIVLLVAAMVTAAAAVQQRAAPKKALTFTEALAQATTAAEAEQFGAAISTLQAAIRDLQKKQRVAVFAGLPKPEGWEIEDTKVDEAAEELSAGFAGFGASIQRRYTMGGDKHISVEVTANSPTLQMMAVMFANPAIVTADGGEIVQYGAHKAILKKQGDGGQELQILMHDKHLIRASSQGLSADDLLKIFDQAFVDRMEKPLGK